MASLKDSKLTKYAAADHASRCVCVLADAADKFKEHELHVNARKQCTTMNRSPATLHGTPLRWVLADEGDDCDIMRAGCGPGLHIYSMVLQLKGKGKFAFACLLHS